MEKLRLRLDDLSVTSFGTAPGEDEARGTVEARELAPTRHTGCPTCATCETNCLPFC